MRQYRGLTKEGKWVYGWYIYGKRWGEGNEHKIIKTEPLPLENLLWIVIPESVGQFTGLKDKNGKEVYEGDIVKGQKRGRGTERIGSIKYKPMHIYIDCDGENLKGLYKIEIIGNIHQHPNLLEQDNARP